MTEPEARGTLRDMKTIREFVLAGNAIFTLENDKTSSRYTYQVREGRNGWFVSVLTGPNNDRDYTSIGMVFQRETTYEYRHFDETWGRRQAATIPPTAPSVRGIRWLAGELSTKADDDELRLAFFHEGSCGACGRRLTDPESIECGLGPVCREK